MKTITINVKGKHINLGAPGESRWCPIALAIKDVLPDSDPSVRWDSAKLTIDGNRGEYALPYDVLEIVDTYDSNGGMEPFTFNLDVPGAET